MLETSRSKSSATQMSLSSEEVTFIAHVISPNGIAPDPAKTSKVEQWQIPTSATKVQQFLSQANYYLLKTLLVGQNQYISSPKKTAFKWISECQTVFEHLKWYFTSAPMPNWSQIFIIDTEALDVRIGAVSSQVDH